MAYHTSPLNPSKLATPVTLDGVRIGTRDYYIRRCPVGYYPAGAVMRWQDKQSFVAGCDFNDGSQPGGGHYETLSEAQAVYDRQTTAYRTRLAQDAADMAAATSGSAT